MCIFEDSSIYTSVDQSGLFSFIKPDCNDVLSQMSGTDLRDLLCYLRDFYLEFRSCLGFDFSVTFGLELECEYASVDAIRQALVQNQFSSDWILKSDRSLSDGVEVATAVLRDGEAHWKRLKLLCSIIHECAEIGLQSGGHIHIGTQVLGGDVEAWFRFISLWMAYENIIYRFGYGNFLGPRSSIRKSAGEIAPYFQRACSWFKMGKARSIADIRKRFLFLKTKAVDFGTALSDQYAVMNTIEFRSPNGTDDPVIWQNNMNFFVRLLECARKGEFDMEVVERRNRLNQRQCYGVEYYGDICLQQALELCDIVFSNNLDKMYFLRQYFKDFEQGTQGMVLSKRFTK